MAQCWAAFAWSNASMVKRSAGTNSVSLLMRQGRVVSCDRG